MDKTHIKNELEAQFKVQAYASWLFNKYVLLREKLNLLNKAIEGDIFVKLDKDNVFSIKKWNKDFLITGPLYGRNLVISSDFEIQDNKVNFKQLSYATKLELKILSQEGFDINILDNFKKFDVKGLRRPILVYPKDLRWKWDKNRGDLLLMFELPSGSYASILVEYLEKLIKK